MAGEITQEAILLALGGAGIGAGGAVASQIVAAIFTGRREKRRFEWDKKQTFSDDKRTVFVAFLRQAQIMHDLFSSAAVGPEDETATATKKIAETKDKWWEEFTEHEVAIRLMAPEVMSPVNDLGALFAEWHYETWSDGPPDGDMLKELSDRYHKCVKDIEPLFQKSLGLQVQKRLKRAPRID
ncbi:hypothetical protein [Paenarthrobacter nitroguajacolicus]|uniref:hypothetical protein n=1 Tax=Paenarthrobacter nitroguajacolicus TaxID=211146 RepID=UPI000B06861A|nr:hypothetical protein [Paenarthrobacter nitroguajacolicus]